MEAVARWRAAKLESEENRYRALVQEDARLQRELAEIEEAAASERRAVSENRRISGAQLAYLHDFQMFAGREATRIERERLQLANQIAEQFRVVLKERQGVQLLDKLREKALAEWNVEFQRDLQMLADEAYSARLLMRSRDQRRTEQRSGR
ncbi:hypothetical protein F183_A49020 [Bryobacterales bacterium F-183]|nr:hypothetical protein F183_A49020 [Bryobacterales bacterium F-183]